MSDIITYDQGGILPLEIYSTILAWGVLGIGLITIVSIILFLGSKKIRAKMQNVSYARYMGIIGVLALASTVFVLTYQFGYRLIVCELCWWQRIFMFPIEFIVATTLIKKTYGNHLTIGGLSVFGIFFAGYHYYLHFKSWVLGQDVFSSCSMGGILPSCTDPAGVVIFGWLTIPFMALVIFITIFWLAILAGQTKKIPS